MTVIDDYLAATPDPVVRSRLEALRSLLRDEVPEGVEVISYRIPTIDLHGQHLVHFAAFARHIGFYPTGEGMAAVKEDLTGFKHSKGSIQFPHDQPLPLDLVRKIVRLRVAQVAANR